MDESHKQQPITQPLPPASTGEKAIVIVIFGVIVVAGFFLLGVFIKSVLFG